VEALQAAISNSSDLRSKLEEQSSGAQLEIAGAVEREKQAPASELPQIHSDRLDAERKAQQAALSSIESRLTQARGDAGYRGERLKIIDPGIVPERPSSPNTSLNIFAALLLGFTLPALYFAVEINFQELRVRARRGAHVLARND
jgi:uncharacterized protein involved in exopolysaccharide biosynthesis